MDDLLAVMLVADHPERNHHREYRISVGRDLFGAWTVTVRYGRVGRGGQERRAAGSAPAMAAVVRHHLLRRRSAPRRIGCEYRLTGVWAVDGFDVEAWLPAELLSDFDRPDPG